MRTRRLLLHFRKTCLIKRLFYVISSLIIFSISGCATLYSPDNRIVARDTALAISAVTAFGVVEWEWFQHSPAVNQEHWFGKNTHAGGSDKTGHAYMSHVLNRALAYDFSRHQVPDAINKAALSALGTMTLIEIGDLTSKKFGLSFEDMAANAIGIGASWWLLKHPTWNKRIDFRMEYWPSPGYTKDVGIVADYSGMKHLIAFKGDGFQPLKGSFMEFLELHTGYYTRGFRSYDKGYFDTPERHLYIGIGISFPRLFKETHIQRLFEFYQPPHTYLEADTTL